MSSVGQAVPRVDGRLKVTGKARYAAEFPVTGVTYAVAVQSTIPRGRVRTMDAREAERAPGVLAILTHRNAPRLPYREPAQTPETDPLVGHPLRVLQDDAVHFAGQHIAVVVADTLERAEHAASLLRIEYAPEEAVVDFGAARPHAFPPAEARLGGRPADYRRGDPEGALARADVRVDAEYTIPTEHHNPIEPHATIAVWSGSRLTLYDKTQWTRNVRQHAALTFGLPYDNVRVISPFVGGAFGSALRAWPHVILAAMAARVVGRPVKLVLTRKQMYTAVGFRPHTVQRLTLGARRDGTLLSTLHAATAQTSPYEEFCENTVNATRYLYACANLATTYRLTRMNVHTPTYMRGPGEISGMFALESAMDELAARLGLDPVELRLRNHADADPESGRPWSSKSLRECYRVGAERIDWSRRASQPRSLRDGHFLVGLGMASATYPTNRNPSSVRVRLAGEGRAVVESSASDIGPGTYTAMTQVAADALGLPPERVRVDLGDSRLPYAYEQGGSQTMASVGPAVQAAALAARARVLALARDDRRSPLYGAPDTEVDARDGQLVLRRDPSRAESYAEVLARRRLPEVEGHVTAGPGSERQRYSMHAFGAHFAEVGVDEDLGLVRVRRVVSAYGVGKVVNPRTARSQALGGTIGGIGMALLEQTHMDTNFGRYTNANLAEYLVPVQADIPVLEPIFVEEQDPHVNPLGAKGLGEITIVGVAAAIANAVYHATGKRVRELPVTLEKLL